MSKKLIKKIAFKGSLHLLSGLYIGDSNEQVDIGGIDRTVVRRPDNNQPYIPGSSLKGKIRSLLEQTRGAANVGDSEEVNKLFGNIENKKSDNRASRLIVRDSYLTEESEKALSESIYTDYPYTEVKFENSIDRVKGIAGNPRKTERVPVGSIFSIELIVNIWSGEDEASEAEQIALLKEGIQLLEADYLGGSGSRGYGQVQIDMDFEKPQILYPGEYAGAK
ncbi:type III-A CRISPR-associated RAMP protein Csm3 [Neolewinella aurantiaca]|uniref:CRISPR system Cms endoribonuclease Csm3 n=1 Tax=Neolewinella aurantiaca TaxID=2602767 RepID=A0A5C7FRC6_9BACT|nr:type III-A CRISPR-associated RAMP protein Csm3 [Neolewinella aurantiaca]TXF87989.1 type III-A CRISPR-associated RAMP protein Csm3 [Neolewinella aurantiaca]